MPVIKNLYNRIRYGLTAGMLRQLHEAERRPIAYDDDAPLLSDAELAAFKPVRPRKDAPVLSEKGIAATSV